MHGPNGSARVDPDQRLASAFGGKAAVSVFGDQIDISDHAGIVYLVMTLALGNLPTQIRPRGRLRGLSN